MESNEQIGPRTYTRPVETFTVCSGCKFLDHQMMRSGMHPIYSNNCRHPDLDEEQKAHSLSMDGNLRVMHGNIITPEWCPVTKQKS